MKGGRGFSLLELLVVIAIIGVLAVVLLPSMSALKSSAELSQSAQVISGELSFARQAAITKNVTVRVLFLSEGDEGETWNGIQVAARLDEAPFLPPEERKFLPLQRKRLLKVPVVFSVDAELSNVLRTGEAVAWSDGGVSYENARALEFYPDGTVSLITQDAGVFTITLCLAKDSAIGQPENFVCFAIDPASGRSRMIRP